MCNEYLEYLNYYSINNNLFVIFLIKMKFLFD